MCDLIRDAIFHFITHTIRREMNQDKLKRDVFLNEYIGMSEFIQVQGRIFRHGFVSEHGHRTIALLQHMFSSFQHFQLVVGPIKQVEEWAQVTPQLLKQQLLRTRLSPKRFKPYLPAPLLEMTPLVVKWLKNVYIHIERLNADWGTQYTDWTEVQLPADESKLKVHHENDAARLQTILHQSSEHCLTLDLSKVKQENDAMFEQVEALLPVATAQFPDCDPDVLICAVLGSLLPDPQEYSHLYLFLSLYSAKNKQCQNVDMAEIQARYSWFVNYYNSHGNFADDIAAIGLEPTILPAVIQKIKIILFKDFVRLIDVIKQKTEQL